MYLGFSSGNWMESPGHQWVKQGTMGAGTSVHGGRVVELNGEEGNTQGDRGRWGNICCSGGRKDNKNGIEGEGVLQGKQGGKAGE
eukprot:20321-Hanusia_phi.AAC.4